MKNKREWIPRIITVIVLIILSISIYKLVNFSKFNANTLSTTIEKSGSWGSLIYICILSILPLFLFPDSIIVIAGGMYFGLIEGSILTSIGSLIGAIIAYLLAKYLGKGIIHKFIKSETLEFTKGTSGFFLILILRLIPLFPFKLISYSAGFAEVDFKEFCLATAIGSLPGIIVYTNLGDNVLDIGSTGFYISIILLVLLTILSFAFKKHIPNNFATKSRKK